MNTARSHAICSLTEPRWLSVPRSPGVWRINFNNYAPNLFTVTAQDETCDTKNNGAILITSKENYTYSYSLNGSNWVSFNSSVTLNNLNGGTYNLCIKLSNDTQYCYVVNIGKPENLKGKIELSGRLAKVQIQSGTAPFTITYGKKILRFTVKEAMI